MPTYQYACTVCGHQIEAVQSFTDAPLTVCPECDGRLRKVFSSVGVVFKGSGFYRTDSRSAANGNGSADSTSKASSSDSKSETSSSSTSGSTSTTGTASSAASGTASSGTKPAATSAAPSS